MSLHELVVYVGVCGGVLGLLRELQAGVRAWKVHRFLMAHPPPPPRGRLGQIPNGMPPAIPRLQYVRHEIACLACGKRLPQYELDEGLEIGRPSQPERHRPCSPEKASVP